MHFVLSALLFVLPSASLSLCRSPNLEYNSLSLFPKFYIPFKAKFVFHFLQETFPTQQDFVLITWLLLSAT